MTGRDLTDDVRQYFYDKLCSDYGHLRFACAQFSLAELEPDEAAALGDPEESGPFCLLIQRESDGALYEVQVAAHVTAILSAADRQKAAEMLPWDCCWVLWAPCGCWHGVTTGRRDGEAVTATEDEAWRSLREERGRIAADKAAGYRMELMTFERYKAEVAPLKHCPHRPEPAGQQVLPGVTGQ